MGEYATCLYLLLRLVRKQWSSKAESGYYLRSLSFGTAPGSAHPLDQAREDIVPRYRMLIEYDGRPFSGWQIQHDRPAGQPASGHAREAAVEGAPAATGSGAPGAGGRGR